jgi:hypothetical protein
MPCLHFSYIKPVRSRATWADENVANVGIHGSVCVMCHHAVESQEKKRQTTRPTKKTVFMGEIRKTEHSKHGDMVVLCTNLALLETEELDVTTNRLPGANGGHDEHALGAAQLERLVLGGLLARRLVSANVRALGHEPAGSQRIHFCTLFSYFCISFSTKSASLEKKEKQMCFPSVHDLQAALT